MRTIKFRAWDGYKMDYSPLVSTYDATVNSEFYFAESNQSGKIFQQFTGLTDMYGKEIYEGDILLIHGVGEDEITLREVVFENGSFNVTPPIQHHDGEYYLMLGDFPVHDLTCEIHGNCYQPSQKTEA